MRNRKASLPISCTILKRSNPAANQIAVQSASDKPKQQRIKLSLSTYVLLPAD